MRNVGNLQAEPKRMPDFRLALTVRPAKGIAGERSKRFQRGVDQHDPNYLNKRRNKK